MIYSRRYFFKVNGGALIAVLAGLIVTPALVSPKLLNKEDKRN